MAHIDIVRINENSNDSGGLKVAAYDTQIMCSAEKNQDTLGLPVNSLLLS